VISALVLAPPVLAALYVGSPYSDVLVCIAAAIAAWEWARLSGKGTLAVPGSALIAVVMAAAVAGALGFYSIAGWVIATGAIGTSFASARTRLGHPLWYAAGAIYLGLAFLAFLWLRADPVSGRFIVLWLIALVWATDIGAYAAGRSIGGPRLAPGISPGKTWAGLAGGVLAAAVAGMAVLQGVGSGESGMAALARIAVASAVLAVVAQLGDLFESHLKRRAGAKDSSDLIPGHGGVLDRIDGLLAAALALGGAIRLTGGIHLAWL
jgi:phosphatidate cytidylyltransferase